MNEMFGNNEQKTNRLLINTNWITVLYGYSVFFLEKVLDIIYISSLSLIIGFIIIILLCGISEIWYRVGFLKNKFNKGLKFYLIAQIIIGLTIIIIISKSPYLMGIYLYPIVAAALYYNDRLIVLSITLDLISVFILVTSNLINISSPPVTTKGIFLVDVLSSLVICMFLIVGYSKKSVRIIEAIKQQEENLKELNQSLESRVETRTKELKAAVEELNAQQEELVALNESLDQTNKDLEKAYKDLEKAQTQMVQHEKMAALGTLVAGVVHEINNPIGALICNIDLFSTVTHLMKRYHVVMEDSKLVDWVQKLEDANKTNTIACTRIVDIVKSLKNFAHLDEAHFQETDIHVGIENTLVLINHRLRDRIEVIKEFGKLPRILCYPNQLNQVFMNLLLNAVEAIIEDKGTIHIKTFEDGNNIYVSMKDTGKGIKHENINKIFDPGFTTKGMGVGKGLGLPICYSVIEQHGGTIFVETKEGAGTEFIIQIPIRPQQVNAV